MMTNPNDRRSTIPGAYITWVEPVVFPLASMLTGFLIGTHSAPTLSMFLVVPAACLALFRCNTSLLGARIVRWRAIGFLAGLSIEGSLALFACAFFPLVVIALFASSSIEAIEVADARTRILIATQLAIVLAAVGVCLRLVSLLMEEFRHLSRRFEDGEVNIPDGSIHRIDSAEKTEMRETVGV